MRQFLTLMMVFVPVGAAQQNIPAGEPVSSTTSRVENQRKIAAIEELLTLMKVDRTRRQFIAQLQPILTHQMEGILSQIPDLEVRAKLGPEVQEFQKQIFAFFDARFDFQNLKPEFIRIYDETFSTDEVAGILEFYKSPIGQAALEKLPVVMAKSGTMVQRLLGETEPEMQKMTSDWVERMKAKYGELK